MGYERDDDGNVLGTTNKVAITFILDPGPDDCVQEFDNDVVLSADLVCDSLKSGVGTTELFHNQMLFCSLTVDAGIEITGMTLIRVENKGPLPAQNDILFPNALGISEFNWANGQGSAVNIHDFEFRVTPKMFRQDFDARNTWFIYALAKVDYAGKGSGSRRLLSLSPSLAKQRAKCLENGCADIGPIRSLLQLDEESGGEVQAASKAFISGLDYQPDVPVVADDVYLADLDMGMEDEEDAAQPIVLNTLVLAGLGFLAMH